MCQGLHDEPESSWRVSFRQSDWSAEIGTATPMSCCRSSIGSTSNSPRSGGSLVRLRRKSIPRCSPSGRSLRLSGRPSESGGARSGSSQAERLLPQTPEDVDPRHGSAVHARETATLVVERLLPEGVPEGSDSESAVRRVR